MKITKYSGNPILRPNPNNQWENFCVLNPAVIYDDESKKFIMLYRAAGDDYEHYIRFGLAKSDDGFHFERCSDLPAMDADFEDADGGCIEDPRIVKIDGVFYITYAGKPYYPARYWNPEDVVRRNEERYHWPDSAPKFLKDSHTTTYLAATTDFTWYKRCGRITDSRYDDRDVVIFPEKVGGKFVRISRPKCDDEPPAVWIAFGDDLMEWDAPKKLFKGEQEWERGRIGAGCPPIKTKDGWLLLYHGVSEKDEFYRVGFVLLDLNDPTKILARTKDFVMEPEFDYEINGIWTGCVFPTGIVEKDGLVYMYYGCADKFVAVATVPLDELLTHMQTQKL
ncbi:MAG: glycosidase [Clostridia bacterium]|nr:glycosidase [Clostridia bacterium]